MKMKAVKAGLMVTAGLVSAMAYAQPRGPQNVSGTGESRLLGISLYATGLQVITKFGSPIEIQALTLGGGAGGPGAQGTGPGGAGPTTAGNGSTGAGAAAAVENNFPLVGDPFGNGQEWRQVSGDDPGDREAGGSGAPANGGRQQGAGAGNSGSSSGTPGTSGGSSGRIEMTRWVYKRGASKYAFVLDKYSRVIQIEAIGMNDANVRTRRGLGFGSSFSSIIRAHVAPDSYEINGDTIVVRCLVKDRVAFRLQRLYADKPHVVTGVVVAAGKA